MAFRFISHPGSGLQWLKLHLGRGVSLGGDRSLRRKLLVGTGIALICAAVLAVSVIGRSLDDYQRTRRNLREIESFRLILDTANLLSAERGPSNSLLGDDGALRDALRERLNVFRARSDAALNRLSAHVTAVPEKSGAGIPPNLLEPVRAQLAEARREIDRVAASPRGHRQLADVQLGVESMFEVVDTFQSIIAWKAKTLSALNPELAAPIMRSRIFGELREYGGRIASQIMSPVAVGQPLALKNLVDSNRTRGRILELWQLIGDQGVSGEGEALSASLRDTQRLFLEQGLGIVDDMIAQGRRSGTYSMTADEFTIRFVQTLKPLERLRSAFLDMTIERLTSARNSALAVLVITTIVITIILATLVGLMVAAQRFVFRPLMRARESVIALAEDSPTLPLAGKHHATEMRRLFEAIDILRGNLAERASLTRQLKYQAETDGLTGLMNRRALDLIGDSHTSSRVMVDGVCLVLLDIDHFKAINDRYGHLQGDHVLKQSVRLIQAMLAPNDIFARFGGEEFAILVPERDLGDTVALAKKIRAAVEANEIELPDGTALTITASFGVAKGNLGQLGWRRLIESADAALYRAKSDGRNCVRAAQAGAPPLVPELSSDTGPYVARNPLRRFSAGRERSEALPDKSAR